jgi:hypothetical protein
VTLCLLSYRALRQRLHDETDLAAPDDWPVLERFTDEWLTDPLLGPSWRAWR